MDPNCCSRISQSPSVDFSVSRRAQLINVINKPEILSAYRHDIRLSNAYYNCVNPNKHDVWEACQTWGGLLEPPYLSQPFMVQFSKFLCLVKACENRHWFLFHKGLPIVHRLAPTRRQSDKGQSRQFFSSKKSKIFNFYLQTCYGPQMKAEIM